MRHILLTAFLIITLFNSCIFRNNDVDLTGINLNIKIHRFEQDIFSLDKDSLELLIPGIENKYGEFFGLFNNKIISIGGTNNKEYADNLKIFLSDIMIADGYRKCREVFPDLNLLENDLTLAFKHWLYYFPDKPVPEIYTYISGYNQSIVTAEKILGIGLDKYFGADCVYYQQLEVPKYNRFRMQKDYIVTDCMTAWAMTEFEFNDSVDNIITNMVYNGMIMYLLDVLLPGYHDTLKIAYSSKQIDWCKTNEKKMWTYLVEKKFLFSSDYMEIKRLFNDGPFTATFSNQSPSRTGVWLGWQIIKSYMKHNPNLKIQDIMKDRNYMKIFNSAGYYP